MIYKVQMEGVCAPFGAWLGNEHFVKYIFVFIYRTYRYTASNSGSSLIGGPHIKIQMSVGGCSAPFGCRVGECTFLRIYICNWTYEKFIVDTLEPGDF